MPWSNNTKICCPLLLFPENTYQPPAFFNNHPDVDPVKLMLQADKITSAVGSYSEVGGGNGVIIICQNDLNVNPKWMTHQLYIKRSSINESILAEHKAVIDTRLVNIKWTYCKTISLLILCFLQGDFRTTPHYGSIKGSWRGMLSNRGNTKRNWLPV